MDEKWIINSAKTVGRSHQREHIPCQDSVCSRVENGVSVIALSDGCGSAPLSHYGSDITVRALCDLLVKDFDILYACEMTELKRLIIREVLDRIGEFIRSDPSMISEIERSDPEHYERFKASRRGFEQIDRLYPLTLFDATLQFVAIKGERMIIGRLGDGVIADVHGGALRILSCEDKVGIESNATWYPTSVLIASEVLGTDQSDRFEVIRAEGSDAYGMFLIASDGVVDVICGEDTDEKERFLYPDEIYRLLKSREELLSILEEQYKPIGGVYDDLSVIMMQRPGVKIESMILRQYDEAGRTVDNSKAIPVGDLDAEQDSVQTDGKSKKSEEDSLVALLGVKRIKRAEKYFNDDEYLSFFMLQSARILKRLKQTESESLDSMREYLGVFDEDEDWILLLRQAKRLKFFEVDEKNGLLLKKERK